MDSGRRDLGDVIAAALAEATASHGDLGLSAGAWQARMVAILQKYGTDRMILNSACDWDRSDPLKVPKTALLMRRRGFSEREIEKVVWHNPVNFFAQSGRLDLAELERPIEATSQFQGNSILRGTPL